MFTNLSLVFALSLFSTLQNLSIIHISTSCPANHVYINVCAPAFLSHPVI